MSLKELHQRVTSTVWDVINNDEEYKGLITSEDKSRFIMYVILDMVRITVDNVNLPIDQYRDIGGLDKKQSKGLKNLFFSLQNKTKFNPKTKDIGLLRKFLDFNILESVVKDVILNVIKANRIPVDNVEDMNKYIDLDDAIFEQEGGLKVKDRTGPIDIFSNSQQVQDNITQLNMYIDKINKELYKLLRTDPEQRLFRPANIKNGVLTTAQLFEVLLNLAGGDKKLISDKYDIIIELLDNDTENVSGDIDSYFRTGIFPLKKVNVSDQNKPTKNANLITGTQNVYKVENTQNPLKISPYVNNDLGDYVVNGKKINIKLVGLNYIVKEGTKTKIFKNLSYAKQFIYNGGFDMYNNNKSKFISNMSKNFNNKNPSLKLSYSSNIF